MNCMRTRTLVVSSYFLFSVQAFAINGNFRSIVESARNAQETAKFVDDPNSTQQAIWTNECDKKNLFINVDTFGENPMEQVNSLSYEAIASATGNIAIEKDGKKYPNASAFAFVFEKGSKDIFVSATAHQFYEQGNWKWEKNSDGSPKLDSIAFYSVACGRLYKAIPSTFKVGSKDVSSEKGKNADGTYKSDSNKSGDTSMFQIQGPVCDKMKPYVLAKVNDSEASNDMKMLMQEKSIAVVGSYDKQNPPPVSAKKEPHAETATVNTDNSPVARYISICSGVKFEKIGNATMMFHRCDTHKRGSGGPVVFQDRNGDMRVIGVHRGTSESSLKSSSNESILFTKKYLSSVFGK